jgi:hypothetical protein
MQALIQSRETQLSRGNRRDHEGVPEASLAVLNNATQHRSPSGEGGVLLRYARVESGKGSSVHRLNLIKRFPIRQRVANGPRSNLFTVKIERSQLGTRTRDERLAAIPQLSRTSPAYFAAAEFRADSCRQ